MSWTDAKHPFRWRELFAAAAILLPILALFHGGALWGTVVFCGGDIVNQDWPLRDYWLREGFATGWYSASFSGYPFFANTQAGVLYPPNLIYWVGLPIERAMTWLMLGHSLWGGLGAYALLRLRVSRAAALFGASLWMCGGYQVLRYTNGVAIFVYGMNWLPWMARAAERLGPGNGRATAALGAAGGLQFLAGAPQLVHISWGGLLVWILGRVLAERDNRARFGIALHAAAALALAGAIAFPQMYASAQFAAMGAERGGDGNWSYIVQGSLPPRVLVTQFLPTFFDVGNSEFTYWGSDVGFLETNAYVGLASSMLAAFGAIALALRARARSGAERRDAIRILVAMAVLCVGGVLIALGEHGPVYRLLFLVVPGFDMFRVPARWILWCAGPAMVLAAMGFQELLDEPPPRDAARGRAWLAVAGATIAALLAVRALRMPIVDALGIGTVPQFRSPELMEQVLRVALQSVDWGLAVAFAAGCAGGLVLFRRLAPRAMASIVAACCAADLLLFWAPFRDEMPHEIPRHEIPSEAYFHRILASEFREFFYPETPLVRALLDAPEGRLLFTDSLYAYHTDEFTREIYADRPAAFGIPSMRGYYPLQLRSYVDDSETIAFADIPESKRPASGAFLFVPRINRREAVDAYNGRNILMYVDPFEPPDARQRLAGMGLVQRQSWRFPPDWKLELWENPNAPGWAWLSRETDWPGLGERLVDAAPRNVERSADRIALDVAVPDGGATLHFAEVDYPGWRIVARNGGNALEASGRSIALGPGEWRVERTFRLPLPTRVGIPVAALAFVACCVVVLRPKRK